MERLLQMVEKARIRPKVRHKSRPTTASKVRRLEKKKHRSGIKKLRSRASGDD